MNNILSSTSEYLNEGVNYVNNNMMISSILALLLVLYVVMAAPALPKTVAEFFNYPVVKFVYLFLIVYLASKERSPTVAIIVVVALLVTLQTLAYYETSEKVLVTKLTTNPTFAAETAATHHTNESIKAIKGGDLSLAHAHATAAAKQEAVAEALKTAAAHKEVAQTALMKGDHATATAHANEAAKHEAVAAAVVNNTIAPTQVPNVLATSMPSSVPTNAMTSAPTNAMTSAPTNAMTGAPTATPGGCSARMVQSDVDVVGYSEQANDEDYANALNDGNINLSGKFEVEGSYDIENFENNLPMVGDLTSNNDLFMSTKDQFRNPYEPIPVVKNVRKYRGEDLANYAPFNESSCDDNMISAGTIEPFESNSHASY